MRRIIGEKDDSFLDAIHSLTSNYRNLCENNDFCNRYLNSAYTNAGKIVANDILNTDWFKQPIFSIYLNNQKEGVFYNKTYTNIGIPWLDKLELYI